MNSEKAYYIESSLGKIPFLSSDIIHVRIKDRKQKDYHNFNPINNRKFLALADRYKCGSMLCDYNIYSKNTKNGVFLIFDTDIGQVEYKIFEDKKLKITNNTNDNNSDDVDNNSDCY